MTLHVERTGSGSPALLVHSSGMSGRQWKKLANALAERELEAIVPDLTGHGRSPAWPEPTPMTFQHDVDELLALLASFDEPAHVIGHSYGAFVALLAARAAPARIRSLSLCEPVAFGALAADDRAARDELAEVDIPWGKAAGDHARWLEGFVDYWNGPGAWTALRPEMRHEFERVGWPLHRGVATLVVDPTPAEAYAVITAPVHLIRGEHTRLAARHVIDRLAAAIPGAHVTVIAGASHMAPLTHANLVNAAILDRLPR